MDFGNRPFGLADPQGAASLPRRALKIPPAHG
jgi:hypothetical protein